MNYTKIELTERRPQLTSYYYTDYGYLKYIASTQKFYNDANDEMFINFWFEETKTFEQAAEPLMKFLAENHHPHSGVIVDSDSAMLFEGRHTHLTDKYIRD